MTKSQAGEDIRSSGVVNRSSEGGRGLAFAMLDHFETIGQAKVAFSKLFEHVNVGLTYVDLDRNIISFNEAFHGILDSQSEFDIIGKNFDSFFSRQTGMWAGDCSDELHGRKGRHYEVELIDFGRSPSLVAGLRVTGV